jgi:hypothetical protein
MIFCVRASLHISMALLHGPELDLDEEPHADQGTLLVLDSLRDQSPNHASFKQQQRSCTNDV